jgi:hypothetical protein
MPTKRVIDALATPAPRETPAAAGRWLCNNDTDVSPRRWLVDRPVVSASHASQQDADGANRLRPAQKSE